MIRWFAPLLAGVLALVLATPADAQRYHVHQYGEVDGLPSSTVRGVAQGRDGRMWFATRVGAASYDGRTWTTYGRDDGLAAVDLVAIAVDDEGVIWTVAGRTPMRVGRNGGSGWGTLEPSRQWPDASEVTHFAVLVHGGATWLAAAIEGHGLYVIAVDRSAGGEPLDWRRVSDETEILALEPLDGSFGFGTPNGLFVMNVADFTFSVRTVDAVAGTAVIGVERDARSGLTWVFGYDWLGLLAGDEVRRLVVDQPFNPIPNWGAVVSQADTVGGVFFGNPSFVHYYNPQTGLEPLGPANGLGAKGATAFALDREDNVWVSSLRGVSKIVSSRFAGFDREHGLLADEVSAVLERRNGEIVLGHPGGLTYFEDRRTMTLGDEAVMRVMDMAEGRDGTLWVAAGFAGLIRLRPGAEPERVAVGDKDVSTTSVVIDPTGNVWVGTTTGVYRYALDEWQQIGPVMFARRLFVGRDRELYLATPGRGLLRLVDERFETFASSDDPAVNSVFSFYQDDAGDALVGTAAGLYRVVDGRLIQTVSPDPVVDNPVYFIVTDDSGRYWLGTDHGVVRDDGERRVHFGVAEGLIGSETNRAAGVLDARGRLWIGTNRGVSVYRRMHDVARSSAPEVRLVELDVNGESRPLDERNRLQVDSPTLLFRFHVTSFVDESRVRFRHRLVGFDDDWVGPDSLPTWELRYAHVPPGEYRLHLQAVDAEGRFSNEAVSAPIVIPRPVWLRAWFLILVVGSTLALSAGVAAYVSQRRYSRRLEREVRARTRELSKGQRLEALGLLAGGIAHDFNNLLTVVLGNLELSRERGNAALASRLARARLATEQAQRLTRQLLTFSSGGAPIRRAASIGQIIHESTSFALSGAEASFEIELPEDLWVVEIDEDQMSQVIGNLLLNARQASRPGGKVRVTGRNMEGAPALLPVGRYVVIEVEDDGAGIPREYLDQVFDPYFTTKEGGSGLGLATAYSIVSRHDGRLTVESEVGCGSVFRIYLPASNKAVQAGHTLGSGTPRRGAGRVLVMDDDRAVRAITAEMLESCGYVVDEATEGQAAVERYRQAARDGRPYDVVIMDLTVPGGMGGKAAVGHLLEFDPDAIAIVVSGYSNDPVMARHDDYGFAACLSKPFTAEVLALTMERVLGARAMSRDRVGV